MTDIEGAIAPQKDHIERFNRRPDQQLTIKAKKLRTTHHDGLVGGTTQQVTPQSRRLDPAKR